MAVTLEQLIERSHEEWPLVLEGRVVPTRRSSFNVLQAMVAANVHDLLVVFAHKHRSGRIFGPGLPFVLSVAEGYVRDALTPHVSFVRRERIEQPDLDLNGPFPGAPDLAVEVVDPSEPAAAVQARIKAYQRAGTEYVWIVYPLQKLVHVYDRDTPQTVQIFTEADVLEPAILFPGLGLPVLEFFTYLE